MQSGRSKGGAQHLCFTLDLAGELISKYICWTFWFLHVFKRNDCGDTIDKDCLENDDSLCNYVQFASCGNYLKGCTSGQRLLAYIYQVTYFHTIYCLMLYLP